MKKKMVKIMFIVLSIVAALAVAVALFLVFAPVLGAVASDEDRQNYAQRTEYFDGKKFRNEHEFVMIENVPEGVPDGIISSKGTEPKGKIPLGVPDISTIPAIDQVTVTWLGHSSLLLQMHGMNILIDPVFSDVPSPVSFVGFKRFSDLPIRLEDLPDIDVLILSHDHYDHLDYDTILKLDGKVKQYIVPLGVENHLERWHVSKDKITNMAWWEEVNINGLTIGCTPARHYSGRSVNDRFASLWASWVFRDEYHSIYESGDSGYDTHYQEIQAKYGNFDFVLIDCAQYNLRWPSVHQNPEQAFTAVEILGAKAAMPIHWGTFRLSSHPWDDPVVRMEKAAESTDVLIATPMIGETMNLANIADHQNRWFEAIQ